LGEALLPFEQRVALAMDHIYTQYSWTPAQRRWLERLAKQLVFEVIIDRDTINQMPAFTGGARQLDKVLGNQLDHVLEGLKEALWDDAAS
jgi:type I restriction enzyme R subunit